LNFATDSYKANGVDYYIVTHIILITVHVEMTIVIYMLISLNVNDRMSMIESYPPEKNNLHRVYIIYLVVYYLNTIFKYY